MKVKIALAVLIIAGIFFLSLGRILPERANRFVEISLTATDIARLARENNLDHWQLVQRLAALGVGSVVVAETTIAELESTGRLTSFFPPDIGRLKMLDLIEPGSPVNSASILTRDKSLAVQIKEVLEKRYSILSNLEIIGQRQPYYLLKFTEFFPEIRDLPVGADPAQVDFFHRAGLKVGLLLKNTGRPDCLPEILKNLDRVLPEKNEVFGWTTADHSRDIFLLGNFLLTNKILFCDFEFNSVAGRDYLLKNFPGVCLRSHLISASEYKSGLDFFQVARRIRRAIRERNVRLVLINLPERIPAELIFNWLRGLVRDISKDGFLVESARPAPFPSRGFLSLRKFFGFCLLLFGPFLGWYYGQKTGKISALSRYLLINFITLLVGILLGIVGTDIQFQQNITSLSGLKLATFGCFLGGIFWLFSFSEIKRWLSQPLIVGWLVALGLAGIVITYWLWRSGNTGIPLPGEIFVREWLENCFYVRPRFKEFLLGQPALFLGLVYNQKWLLLVGLVGQISVMNTFAHFHTPLWLSILRTLVGIFLGLGLGVVIQYGRKKLRK